MPYAKRQRTNVRGRYVRRRGISGGSSYRRRIAFVRASGAMGRGRNRMAYRNMRTGGLLGLEKKYFDQADTATIPFSTSLATNDLSAQLASHCLNAPATGDGAQNREGRKIYCIGFQVNGALTITPRADQGIAKFTTGAIMLAIVLDKQNNAAQAVEAGEVWDNPVDTADAAVVPFRNMSNSSRFVVLKKKLITVRQPPSATIYYDSGAGNTAETSGSMNLSGWTIPFTMYCKGGFNTSFKVDGTSSDSANITDNCVRFYGLVTSSDFDVEIAYSTRMRFYG